ncbi:MAG: hypothetical protein V7K53_18460 [Nostoc sp.]
MLNSSYLDEPLTIANVPLALIFAIAPVVNFKFLGQKVGVTILSLTPHLH